MLNLVCLQYAETIPKYTKMDYPEECSNPDITHVVTSVTYGLDANFIFKYLLTGTRQSFVFHCCFVQTMKVRRTFTECSS